MRRWFARTAGIGMLAFVGCSRAQDTMIAPTIAPNDMPTARVATPSPIVDRCFGDSPPEQIAADPRPRDLFATGSEVLWRSGEVLHRMDVEQGSTSTLDVSALFIIKAADSREVFGADHQLSLLAIDLSSGKLRTVSPSSAWNGPRVPGLITLWSAYYVPNSDYVYVGWHGDPATYNFYSSGGDTCRRIKGPHDAGFLSRLKRDGSNAPELLGRGPDDRFVVSDGYAYWGSRWEGLKRRALVPGGSSEVLWAAPDVPLAWPIGVSGGRLYFSMIANEHPPYTFSLASVPAAPDGGAASPPRVHVAALPGALHDAILDGKCVYSGGPSGVLRASLDDGTVQMLVEGRPVPGDATVMGSRFLASDGHALYWADNGGDRVIRWRR